MSKSDYVLALWNVVLGSSAFDIYDYFVGDCEAWGSLFATIA